MFDDFLLNVYSEREEQRTEQPLGLSSFVNEVWLPPELVRRREPVRTTPPPISEQTRPAQADAVSPAGIENGGAEPSEKSSSLDRIQLVQPEFAKSVVDQIGLNPVRQEDQLAVEYLTATDPTARQLALENLSRLPGETARVRFVQMQSIDAAIRIDDSCSQLLSPQATQQERNDAKKELNEALKVLAGIAQDRTPAPGTLPGEATPRQSEVQKTVADILVKVGKDGFSAEVQQAKQDCFKDAMADRQTAERALNRFTKLDATPADRASAIKQLEDLNRKDSNRSFEPLLDRITTADSVMRLREARTPQARAEALQYLSKLGESGNVHAKAVERFIRDEAGNGIASDLLDTKNEGVAERATKTLGELVNKAGGSAAEIVADVCLRAALDKVSSHSNIDALTEARKKLEGLGESTTVKDWLAWTKNEEVLKRLGDPRTSKDAFEELKSSYRLGDPYAKVAMSKILLADASVASEKWEGLDSTKTVLGGKVSGKLDLSSLPTTERAKLQLAALEEIKENGVKVNGLSASEFTALALAFERNYDSEPFRTGIKEIFSGSFYRKVTGEERFTNHTHALTAARETEKGLNGLFDAMSLTRGNSVGARALLLEYARAANSPDNRLIVGDRTRLNDIGRSFDNQIGKTIDRARKGDETALSLLGLIASGVGKGNTLNNPQVFDKDRKSMVDGSDRAKRAGAALESIAETYSESVIKTLTDGLFKNMPDSGVRLETLGKVLSKTDNVTEKSKEALMKGLTSSDSQTRRSTARGIIFLLSDLNGKDLQDLVKYSSKELAVETGRNIESIPFSVGRKLVQSLTGSFLDGQGMDVVESATGKALMLGVLGRFVVSRDLSSLAKLSGKEGLKTIEAALDRDASSEELRQQVQDNAKVLQRTFGKMLLSIAGSSLEEGGRVRAISVLSNRDWNLDTRTDKQLREDLEAFGKRFGDNPGVSLALSKLSYNADKPSLAAQFRSLGLPSMSDVRVRALTESAVKQYGSEKVQQVLDATALFLALPADARAKLVPDTTDQEVRGRIIRQGVDPSQVLRQLADGSLSNQDSSLKFLLSEPSLEERVYKLHQELSAKNTEAHKELSTAKS
ncbi:MAG: hypothetical protein K2Z81_03680, partial [Cyanobacteria bacterium]|nr:hypothetical protein [Cyanobacteriota bacterium]